jgi:hypothetical protein
VAGTVIGCAVAGTVIGIPTVTVARFPLDNGAVYGDDLCLVSSALRGASVSHNIGRRHMGFRLRTELVGACVGLPSQ